MQKILYLFILVLLTSACSIPSLDTVLSDERTAYEKSNSLPPLEVPPDLAQAEADEAMSIPGEAVSKKSREPQVASAEKPVSPEIATSTNTTTTITPAPVSSATSTATQAPNVIVAVHGDKQELWDRLRAFMTGKGFPLDLDDLELGYLETHWSPPQAENGLTFRYKFKLYSEPGPDAGVILYFIENAWQEQKDQGDGNTIWVDRDRNIAAEQRLAREMNAYFNGDQQQAAQSQAIESINSNTAIPVLPTTTSKILTEIQDLGEGKLLLAIAEEYTLAWRHTEQALQAAGLTVNSKEQEQGVYHITYNNAGAQQQGGWTSKLKKLKFWGDDKPKGTNYQIALTGVGDKTELVLLDEGGEWVSSETARPLLDIIQTHYNNI